MEPRGPVGPNLPIAQSCPNVPFPMINPINLSMGSSPYYVPGQGGDVELCKYNGSIPWRVYEVKLSSMANYYQWDDRTKLAKLVDAFEGEALSYFSSLSVDEQLNLQVVIQKMNNRFFPKDPAITVRRLLFSISQNPKESLEEWSQRCQHIANDAWGEMSPEVARISAIETFLTGALDKDASYLVLQQDISSIDEALHALKRAIHTKCILGLQSRSILQKMPVGSQSPSPMSLVDTNSLMGVVPKLEAEVRDLHRSMIDQQSRLSQIYELLREGDSFSSPKCLSSSQAPSMTSQWESS